MILVLLGILDLIGGILLGISGFVPYTGSDIVSTIGLMLVIKGAISYLSGASKDFYLDFMGVLDAIAGILLLVETYGLVVFFFPYIGILLALKGIYSMVIGLLK